MEVPDPSGAAAPQRFAAVIDSNRSESDPSPALTFLRQRGINRLNFLALTHPHTDHYDGLGTLAREFEGPIGRVFTFPINRTPDRLKSIVGQYVGVRPNPNPRASRSALEFVNFLSFAKDKGEDWEDPTVSITGDMYVTGFPGVTFTLLLPPARVKGSVLAQWAEGRLDQQSSDLNELSLAILVEYAGRQVLLAGDGVDANWRRQAERWTNLRISPLAVKLPHHGSSKDCADDVLDALFPPDPDLPERFAIISANGKSHPANEVLSSLVARGIKPYCTNLATRCGGEARQVLSQVDRSVSPDLQRSIEMFAVEPARVRPCQGTITLEILPDGRHHFSTEVPNLCFLRGGIPGLTPVSVVH